MSSEGPTHAMILAAGRGTRLGALSRMVPKALVEVGDQPLLARQIAYLRSGGVGPIVINAHHLAEQIQDFVAGHPCARDIDVVREPKLLGTAGGVRNALHLLGDDPFVVLYGDVIVGESIQRLLAAHVRSGARATLTLYRSTVIEGKGTVELDCAGRVTAFREKAAADADREALVNAGLYVLDPELISQLPSGVELDFGNDVFPAALARGEQLAGHLLEAPVIDMGTPAMLQQARGRFE